MTGRSHHSKAKEQQKEPVQEMSLKELEKEIQKEEKLRASAAATDP